MSGWTVILGHEARRDLWTFPWDRDNEVGGVVFGRHETAGINRYDDGRHVFVRRLVAADRGGDSTSVNIDYESVRPQQTIMTRGGLPGSRGRWGRDDFGLIIGSIHSHPGIDRQRELSGGDIRSAAANAADAVPALAGKPFLSVLATAGEAWEAGEPEEDWIDPVVDYFLVFPDRSIIRPRITVMTETEWLVEESQRELIAIANGGDER